jgi:acetate kinase
MVRGMTADPRLGLVLNSGSSSLKFATFDLGDEACPQIASGEGVAAFDSVGGGKPIAIGHRIVHGGPRLLRHCRIDAAIVRDLEAAERFAPLHVPAALSLLRAAMVRFPAAAQIACFDTAFHADLPDVARTLPIPRALRGAGLRRYGFHGLSCESIVHQLGERCPERLIVAHLGNGVSVTAIRDRRSIDTSMGLTPSGGAIMGTRTGDLDPGIILHLLRQEGATAASVEAIVIKGSGLLGISGLSSDMRALRAAAAEPDADLAIRMFSRSVAKQIAAMMTALGGADMLVFTGGIGEHDGETRDAIMADLAWTGTGGASFAVATLPSGEEQQIARHMRALLS